jgi:hypothetical protein
MRDSWADYYRTSYCLAKLRQGAWATIADFTSDPAPSPSHAPLRAFAPALFYVYSETSTPRNHAPAPHSHGSAMSKLVSDFFDGVRAFLDGTDETPNTSVCHESSCLHSFRLWVDLLSVFLAPSSSQSTNKMSQQVKYADSESRALSPLPYRGDSSRTSRLPSAFIDLSSPPRPTRSANPRERASEASRPQTLKSRRSDDEKRLVGDFRYTPLGNKFWRFAAADFATERLQMRWTPLLPKCGCQMRVLGRSQ